MPKRTNALQKAIKIVEKYKGVFLDLEESAILVDRDTDGKREVDIVLRGKINNFPIIVSIEVTAKKRPVDTKWVEEMIAKHSCLPTDKLILISSSGFTKPAQQKASVNGVIAIDTSKGDKALREFLQRTAFIQGISLNVHALVDNTPIPVTSIIQIGEKSGTIEEQANVLLSVEKFKEIIFASQKDGLPGLVAEVKIPFSIDGVPAKKGQILKFLFFLGDITKVPVKLSTIEYQGTEYIFGEFGEKPHYIVVDMGGKLIGLEEKK
jgi:hypothetical protein